MRATCLKAQGSTLRVLAFLLEECRIMKSIIRYRQVETQLALTWILALILMTYSSIFIPAFLTHQNLYFFMLNIGILGILSIGMTYTILAAGIDLAMGSVVSLACALTGLFEHWGIYFGNVAKLSFIVPEPLVFVLVVAVGATVGALNGIVIGKTRVPDFAVTLGTGIVVQGLAYTVVGGNRIYGLGQLTQSLANLRIGPFVPFPFVIFFAVGIISYVMLTRIPAGKMVYAVGESEKVAYVAGVSRLRARLFVYVISGVLASIAGILIAAENNVGDPSVGPNYLLLAIAAPIIGGVSIYGGFGGVEYAIGGTVIIVLIQDILGLYAVLPNEKSIFLGLILVIVLVSQRFLRTRVRSPGTLAKKRPIFRFSG